MKGQFWRLLSDTMPFKAMIWVQVVGAILVITIAMVSKYFETSEESTYSTQVQKLNQTEKSLQDLLTFVQNQRETVVQAEAAVRSLKNEHEKLQPLLKADKQVVEALLAAQEERSSSKLWQERTISFALGVLASLLATVVWTVVARYFGKKAETQGAQTL